MSTQLQFKFPQFHSFPPFYTRQSHEETWRKQREIWIEIILGYCGWKRIFEIDLNEEGIYQWPLFYNAEIDRKIDKEFLKEIFTEMIKEGKGSWQQAQPQPQAQTKAQSQTQQKIFLIYWRSPLEWSKLIYKFVEISGGIGSIFTVYDLVEGDDTVREEFHGLPQSLMKIVVNELEKSGKVRLFSDDNSSSSSFNECGLKFF